VPSGLAASRPYRLGAVPSASSLGVGRGEAKERHRKLGPRSRRWRAGRFSSARGGHSTLALQAAFRHLWFPNGSASPGFAERSGAFAHLGAPAAIDAERLLRRPVAHLTGHRRDRHAGPQAPIGERVAETVRRTLDSPSESHASPPPAPSYAGTRRGYDATLQADRRCARAAATSSSPTLGRNPISRPRRDAATPL
jgi:hypothetical protein